MKHPNGVGSDPALTGIEALKFVTGKVDRQTSKTSLKIKQAVWAGSGPALPAGRIASDSPPSAKSSVATVSSRFLREETDTYPAIAVLNGKWRVVVCKHSIQWILQRRGGERWRSQYFCRSRLGLILCVREYAGSISGDALVILLKLPEWIGGGHG